MLLQLPVSRTRTLRAPDVYIDYTELSLFLSRKCIGTLVILDQDAREFHKNIDFLDELGLFNRPHYDDNVPDLILLRHGRSEWNELNLFTGWHDVDLNAQGEVEAAEAGRLLAASDLDLRVLHTSLLTRAIRTAEISLYQAGRSWLPVRRSWRLNERHYGDLTGKDKKQTADEFGIDQVKVWRRSYDVPPPPMPAGDPRSSALDPRYRDVASESIPMTECLKDVVTRVTPYFTDVIAEDLRREGVRGGAVLVVAHGNSLRALRKILQNIDDDDIAELEIPTGIPYVMKLDESLDVLSADYLGDPAAAAAAAEAVARQAG